MLKKYRDQALSIVNSMALEQKIGQMIMASIEGREMGDKTRAFLRKGKIGNVILFGKNCSNRRQIAELNRRIQAEVTAYTGGVQALISIDQEGGIVTRIQNGATVFSGASAVGAVGRSDYAYEMGKIMGEELRALGISYNLAPVLDTDSSRVGKIPDRRSFGPSPEITSLYGGAYARGLRDAGVIDTGKHFPGCGDTPVDTHFGTSIVHTSREEAMKISVQAFRQVFGEGMRSVMIDHTCYTGLDPACVPASVSRPIIQGLAREELGFEGLIISDGMQMLAIENVYGAPKGCVLAAQAGCDLLIVGSGEIYPDPYEPDTQSPCIRAMIEAAESGELSLERINESACRIIAMKLRLGDLSPADGVEDFDWSEHEAFSRRLSKAAVRVIKDEIGILPLPSGALFLSRVPKSRLGVEEGDTLVRGFAPFASDQLNGKAVEFRDRPDLGALSDEIAAAPAVVFSVANRTELEELKDDLKAVCALNKNTALILQDVPEAVRIADCAPTAIATYDQTINAMRAACDLLMGK